MSPPAASIVIVTKNRREVLRRAIETSLAQDCNPEVLVLDDGSTDGTSEMVRADFPRVQLHQFANSEGYIGRRNSGVRLSHAPVVVLIDDDTTLDDTSIVSQTVADFDHPRVGAVAIPFRVPPKPEIHKAAPDGSGVWVTSSFIGCSHAVNRELFHAVGGFRESLHHYGEESDFCMRLLNAGWVTRCGRSAPATHHASPLARGTDRQRFFAARNAVLFAWHNVPFPYFPLHLGAVTAREMRQFVRYGGLRATFAGVSRGYRDGIRAWSGRRPLRPEIYRLIRRIKKCEPVRFDEIGSALGEAPPKESVLPDR